MKRERLGSRLGFILLSAGCAIGCGNVWKFLWMTGQYGGGKKFVKEANTEKGPKIQNWMRPVFTYVVPVIIAFLYVYGMVTFKWR